MSGGGKRADVITENELARWKAAFDLVSPDKLARKRFEAKAISLGALCRASWRDPISALVLESELRAAGVTLEDLRQGIIHYTATVPIITAQPIGKRFQDPDGTPERPGYFVQALGYRAGPAGDH